MVQGLAFLSKKSWHTKNKANQEKVWIAEQQQEHEAAKAKELAREIQQEREAEEFNKIAGKSSVKDRGIDWMYQQGTSTELAKEDATKKAEEYLLGKEFVGEGAVQGDFHDGNQKEGIHSALSKKEPPVATSEIAQKKDVTTSSYGPAQDSVQFRNENFRMRVEDPMFAVSQREREKKDQRDKTSALYDRVVGPAGSSDDDSSTDSRKRSKKDRKRRKKKKKKKSSRSRRDYDDKERSSRRRRRRSRSRSRSRSRTRSRSRSRSNDRHQRYSRDNDSLSDGSYHRRRDRYDDRHNDRYRDSDRKSHHRDRNHRRDYDDNRDYRSRRDGYRKNDYSRRDRRERDYDRASSNPEKASPPKDDRSKKMDGYGLKGGSVKTSANRDIGPSKELLRKKREEQQNLRNRNMQIGRSRSKMTGEERAAALREMQSDARKREDRMEKKASYRKGDDDDDRSSERKGASFLSEINNKVNGMNADGSSLSSRVAQNRHTNQRLHDSFL